MSDMIKGTMISYRPDIKVLDATIRDGGLVNNFEFTDDFVRKLYLTNLRAGVDIMEIGYLADPELFEESKFGKWKFCHEDAIRKVLGDILDPKMQLAVMADVGRANVARDLPDKKDSILDVVRIATYINTIPAAIEMIETCAKKGYHTTVNIMAVSKAQESELEEALEMLGKSSVEVIYLVDSYGSLYPLQMRQLAQRYLEAGEKYGKKIGIHAHNNQQLAFANTTECAMMGVSYLDATMAAMGRGAGNCAMELLLHFLNGAASPFLISSNIPQALQHKQPHRQRECTEQSGHHHGAGSDGTLVFHVFCHDKAAARGGAAQHNENGDELFRAESQPDRRRQKQTAEQKQLYRRDAQRQPQLALGTLQLERRTQGDQRQRRCHIAQVGYGFLQDHRLRDFQH